MARGKYAKTSFKLAGLACPLDKQATGETGRYGGLPGVVNRIPKKAATGRELTKPTTHEESQGGPMGREILSAILMAAILIMAQASKSLASSFGTLSNFDVINDTGSSCHGFEIELEDLHSSDVSYTFGGTYIRYGSPELVDATTDPAHPRVIVRYRHWNGSEWEATPIAPAGITASGHDCYSGGPVGNYLTSGCEHFGVSLRTSPSRTSYRWLIAANPSDLNTAFNAVPENVNLPVPVWNVIPRAGGGVDVRAEVEPIEEENHAQYGEPQWLRVFKVETDFDLQPEDLNRSKRNGSSSSRSPATPRGRTRMPTSSRIR